MQTLASNGSAASTPMPPVSATIGAGMMRQDADAAMPATAVPAYNSSSTATADDLYRAAPFVCAREGNTGRPEFVLDFPAGHRVLGISDDGMRLATRLVDDTNALIDRGAYTVDRFGKLAFTAHGFQVFDAYYLGERTAGKLYAHEGAQEIADIQLIDGITVDPGFFYTKITLDRSAADTLIINLAMGAFDAAAALNLPLTLGLGTAALVTQIANSLGDNGVCIYFVTLNPLIPPQILPRF